MGCAVGQKASLPHSSNVLHATNGLLNKAFLPVNGKDIGKL